jgi:LPPG:FO 2-phospho-L-lactate transferase
VLPLSVDPCPTLVSRRDSGLVHFEEYLVRDGAPDDVVGVDLSAARRAKPAPGVLESLRSAGVIVLCPSNPVVSIGPILAVPGIREAIRASGAPVVAISPIIAGAPVKGPASQLLRGLGIEISARGVAELYREVVHAFVLDQRDAALEEDVRSLGLRTAALDTLMRDDAQAARLAEAALRLAARMP